ncbi:MAG TPA: thermonuclease family protein [Gemmatimonadales bacterium]|nr:thermonuclease family protein [Gemmatimonadales bacterium]
MYQYRADVIRIVDGDTLHLDVDLGFDIRRADTFRLYGINAPELSTAEGLAAKDWLTDQLAGGIDMVTTHKDTREKYGRYLGTLWVDGVNINEAMVEAGHAVPYSGGSRTIEQ